MFIEQDLYQELRAKLPIVCVDLLVISKERWYLLVKRSESPAKGVWWFPGGRIFKGEAIKDACLRKAREELGIELDVGDIVSVEESIFKDEDPVIHTINIIVASYLTGDRGIALDKAHCEYRWEEFADPTLHPCIYNPLVKAGFSKKWVPGGNE